MLFGGRNNCCGSPEHRLTSLGLRGPTSGLHARQELVGRSKAGLRSAITVSGLTTMCASPARGEQGLPARAGPIPEAGHGYCQLEAKSPVFETKSSNSRTVNQQLKGFCRLFLANSEFAVISVHASKKNCRNPSILRFSNATIKLKSGYTKANVLVRALRHCSVLFACLSSALQRFMPLLAFDRVRDNAAAIDMT